MPRGGAGVRARACGPRTRRRVAARLAGPAVLALVTTAAVAGAERRRPAADGDRVAWVALAGGVPEAPVSATGAWRIDERGGRVPFVRGEGGEPWRIERRGTQLRVAGPGGDATPWRQGPFVASAVGPGAFVQYGHRRYRGELWFTATDTGVLVVNRVPVEDYLRGVVPIELGTRNPLDHAALEAQAIAARTYTYARVPAGARAVPAGGWQLTAGVAHQVYGGVDVEHPVVDAAIGATARLVLVADGRLVDAPYHAACGGRTAAPRDAWRDARDLPHLQGVDDLDPATGRPWCDLRPGNHWRAEFSAAELEEAVRRALAAQGARDAAPAPVQGVEVVARSPSGRVARLLLRTARGDVAVWASELRTVFRDARGAILASTYFSVDREARAAGRLEGVTLRGAGNGHGVGMCQWGAIGRARAGQDARTILRHYYPGTAVGFAD
jgi:stage II sporulation protein D